MKGLGFRMFIQKDSGDVFEIDRFESLLNITFDACHYVQMDDASPKEVSKAAGFVCKWIWNLFQRINDELTQQMLANQQKGE